MAEEGFGAVVVVVVVVGGWGVGGFDTVVGWLRRLRKGTAG